MNEPLCDPLVPPRWRVPLNLRLPTAPLALPVPPVALVTPWKVIVTLPLSPLEHPCCELDWVTTNVILFAPLAMVPLPPKGSHSDEPLFGALPLPLTALFPKREFWPVPDIEEIVTALLSMSSDALPVNLAENLTVLAVATAIVGFLAEVLLAAAKAGVADNATAANGTRTPRTRNLFARNRFLTMQLSIPAGGEEPIGPKDPTLTAVRLSTSAEGQPLLASRCLFQPGGSHNARCS